MEIDRPTPAPGADQTPAQVVSELDKFIVGQRDAKRAVAVALRNRWRRKQVPADLRDEISPKNIILIGPTGVGKTEIARRLAKLAKAPFLKVEATKFTEVGYVGKDVESMIRDLVETAIQMVRAEMESGVQSDAEERANERILQALYPDPDTGDNDRATRTREKLARLLSEGHLDDRVIEIEVRGGNEAPGLQFMGNNEQLGNLQDMLKGLVPSKSKKRKVTVAEARPLLLAEEAAGLVDGDTAVSEALRRVEQDGIVFIDEIDKIAASQEGPVRGPQISREGVQRDILPIVEGTAVKTRHGVIKTDHILFVAAGAFHVAAPSDLIPELQGRFPIRVELQALTEQDLQRILVEPDNALTRQYRAMMATEGIDLIFGDAAVRRIAAIAHEVNARQENIGARRLHTVLEALLEDLSFDAPERSGEQIHLDAGDVDRRLAPILGDQDLSRYIL